MSPAYHVYYTRWRLHTVPSIAERQAGEQLRIPIFIVFGLTRQVIEPKSTVSVTSDSIPGRIKPKTIKIGVHSFVA